MTMKMKRTFITLLTMCVIIIAFVGCENSDSTSTEKKKGGRSISNDAINIEDIDWNVDKRLIFNGYAKNEGLSLNYTNNTKYTIVDMRIEFEQKSSIQKKARKKVLNRIIKEGLDEDIVEIYLVGENMKQANPGETVSDARCSFNGTIGYFPTSLKEYEIMEPKEMRVKFIGSDGKLHDWGYDFKDKTALNSSDVTDAYTWIDNEYTKLLPKPEVDVVTEAEMIDDGNTYYFEVRGATKDIYEQYIKQCKDKGFNIKTKDYWNGWDGYNEEGYQMNIYYTLQNEFMRCELKMKPDKN